MRLSILNQRPVCAVSTPIVEKACQTIKATYKHTQIINQHRANNIAQIMCKFAILLVVSCLPAARTSEVSDYCFRFFRLNYSEKAHRNQRQSVQIQHQ